MTKCVTFILNPFSGVGKKGMFPRLLESVIDKSKITAQLVYTEGPQHAKVLTQEAIDSGCEAVVVVGGDGSVNEVGSVLIGSKTALGIIPAGSGNGVARSLGLELNHRKALKRINEFELTTIDTGLMDGRPFIGIAGIGFDAHVGARFEKRKTRGKLSYGYVMMTEFKRFDPVQFTIKELEMSGNAFVLAFANTTQYGNNAVIAPIAEFHDGQLELVCIKSLKVGMLPAIMLRLFNKSLDKSEQVKMKSFEKISVLHNASIGHVDGEPISVGPTVTVEIVPQSLQVII